MDQTKLTIRLPRNLLEGAKRYASEHDTTLTRLVSAYFEHLAGGDSPFADAPTVRRLTGTLSRDASVYEYRKYLEDKYGHQG